MNFSPVSESGKPHLFKLSLECKEKDVSMCLETLAPPCTLRWIPTHQTGTCISRRSRLRRQRLQILDIDMFRIGLGVRRAREMVEIREW